MFEKRKFIKEFCREQNGEEMYSVQDESGRLVFVDRIFPSRDADAILALVEQAYEQGLIDMSENITEAIKLPRQSL